MLHPRALIIPLFPANCSVPPSFLRPSSASPSVWFPHSVLSISPLPRRRLDRAVVARLKLRASKQQSNLHTVSSPGYKISNFTHCGSAKEGHTQGSRPASQREQLVLACCWKLANPDQAVSLLWPSLSGSIVGLIVGLSFGATQKHHRTPGIGPLLNLPEIKSTDLIKDQQMSGSPPESLSEK